MAEASGSQSMSLNEYKNYIIEIIGRLHNENSLFLKNTITPEGKTAFVVEFHAPEWFRELNEDIQKVAFDNLQSIMMERVSDVVTDIECAVQGGECDCCEYSPKRSSC